MTGKRWFYVQKGQRQGPVDLDQLIGLIDSFKIPSDTLVWRQGQDGWLPADATPEIAAQFPPAVPGSVQRGSPRAAHRENDFTPDSQDGGEKAQSTKLVMAATAASNRECDAEP